MKEKTAVAVLQNVCSFAECLQFCRMQFCRMQFCRMQFCRMFAVLQNV